MLKEVPSSDYFLSPTIRLAGETEDMALQYLSSKSLHHMQAILRAAALVVLQVQ